MTALHWAASNGNGGRRAPVARARRAARGVNGWEGTVLDSTIHFAIHMPVEGVDYVPVLERLLLAGANVDVVDYPTGKPPIDAALARYGAGKAKKELAPHDTKPTSAPPTTNQAELI